MTPTYSTAATLFGSWLKDVETGEPPVRFVVPPPFASLDLRPGRLLLFGGAPGGGKTAALLQIVFDLLRGNDGTKALIANVEMPPERLFERQLSRLSGIPLNTIQARSLTNSQRSALHEPLADLRSISDRLVLVQPL